MLRVRVNRWKRSRSARDIRSYAQQRVIVIDVEQRAMIANGAAGCVAAPMIRIAAEVLENPVRGAS